MIKRKIRIIALLTTSILFSFGCMNVSNAQNNVQHEQQLQLTTRLINQTYCDDHANMDIYVVNLKLMCIYMNSGSEPIILYTGDVSYLNTFVGLNEEEALAGKYFETGQACSSIPPMRVKEGEVPSKEFIILQAGGIYEKEMEIILAVDLNSTINRLPPRDYVLQIGISTWSGTEKQAKRLKEKWKNSGLLYTRGIKSNPMAFTISANPVVIDCPSPSY